MLLASGFQSEGKFMNPDFWSHQPKTIARLLLGKSIIFGSTQATILKAQAFSREENSQDGLYRPLLEMSPGEVYCARRRNAVLLLFVTLDNGRVGGCVLIRTVEVNRSIYDGPGKTSAELGLNDHGRKGRTEWVDEETVKHIKTEGFPEDKAYKEWIIHPLPLGDKLIPKGKIEELVNRHRVKLNRYGGMGFPHETEYHQIGRSVLRDGFYMYWSWGADGLFTQKACYDYWRMFENGPLSGTPTLPS
jgi:hypothetical protein